VGALEVGEVGGCPHDSQQRWHDLFVPEVHLPCMPWRWRRNRCDQPLQGGTPTSGSPYVG